MPTVVLSFHLFWGSAPEKNPECSKKIVLTVTINARGRALRPLRRFAAIGFRNTRAHLTADAPSLHRRTSANKGRKKTPDRLHDGSPTAAPAVIRHSCSRLRPPPQLIVASLLSTTAIKHRKHGVRRETRRHALNGRDAKCSALRRIIKRKWMKS